MNMDLEKRHKKKRKSDHPDSAETSKKKHKSKKIVAETPEESMVPETRAEFFVPEDFESFYSEHQERKKKKKKKKKHKNDEEENSELSAIQQELAEEVDSAVAADICIPKKKKKRKEEEPPQDIADTPTQPITKKKKKKKHKAHLTENVDLNDSITLDMLKSNSTVLINELSELKQSAPSINAINAGASTSRGESSKLSRRKSREIKTVSSDLLPLDAEDGSDIDGQLQTKKAIKTKKKVKTKNTDENNSKDIVDDNDPEVQLWLNSLDDDLLPENLGYEPCQLHMLFPNLRWMSSLEKEQCLEKGIKIRLGKWSHKEDTILRKNFEEFVKKFKIPSVSLILGINKRAKDKINPKLVKYLQLKKFYYLLGKDLNERSLYSTYQRARRLFHPMNKSRLKPEELAKVFRLQAKVGNKWSTISELMNKPSKQLFEAARYSSEKKDTGDWTAEENEKLINAVKRKLKLGENGTCRKLPWKKIAKKVGTRSSTQCCRHWLHNLCWKFSHGEKVKPKWTDDDSLKLIQHLYSTGAETEADLDWNEIFTKFSKVASYSELHYKWYLLKIQVPDHKEKDLEDILLFLKRKFEDKKTGQATVK